MQRVHYISQGERGPAGPGIGSMERRFGDIGSQWTRSWLWREPSHGGQWMTRS